MNHQTLMRKLNWFYSLEVHQVDLYLTQSSWVSDEYTSRTLKKFADIEKSHVANTAKLIETLGGTPTIVGEVVGEIVGTAAATISAATGLENLLKYNIALEKKAMEDYKNLILKVKDAEVNEVLWNNLLDEDLHTAWMVNKLKKLKQKTPAHI